MPNAPYSQAAVRFIAAHTGLPEKDIRLILCGLMAYFKLKLVRGQNLHLREFGTFRPVWRPARVQKLKRPTICSRGGTEVHIKGHWRIKFKPAKALRAAMLKNLPDPTQQPKEQDEQ